MAYPKRVYTDGIEDVSYVDMNRIEAGIETNDLAIAKINADNIARDKEISTKETITGAQEKANVTLKSAKEYTDGKVKLNGTTTNVNFIENEIAQDGLVGQLATINTMSCFSNINVNSVSTDTDIITRYSSSALTGWKLYVKTSGYYCLGISSATGTKWIQTTTTFKKSDTVLVIDYGTSFKVFCNNLNTIVYESVYIPNTNTCTAGIFTSWLYNRVLTPQEIQHNFSVLNNTASINKINDYAISTDTDHIQDRTGRTTEQINRAFYKNMCKEFTSSGESISVNNGMDGYLLQSKIEGNTVKCIYADSDWVTVTGDGVSYKSSAVTIDKISQLKPSNTYVLLTEVKTNTLNYDFRVNSPGSNRALNELIAINVGKTGLYKNIVTSLSSFDVVTIGINSVVTNVLENGSITFRRCLIEITDVNKVNSFLPFGLSSTQAVISNLGVKYSFYLNNEDKLAEKVIDLGGIDGARNTFEIKEDGSAIYTQNSKKEIFDGTSKSYLTYAGSNIGWDDANTSVWHYYIAVSDWKVGQTSFISDKFKTATESNRNLNVEMIQCHTSNNSLFFQIDRAKMVDASTATFKNYLQLNNITMWYALATPIVTTIPKELVPAILTQLQNEFKFGEGVAPYKVTIQAPTTDDIAKSYTVTLLNGYTQTVGTATPVVNLANTGIVRLQMDLTAPTTGMNATIFTLPTELRPVTTQRIPVFVNGVSQLATIDKTTGNVNLASVPSASANIYIKTDYRRDI